MLEPCHPEDWQPNRSSTFGTKMEQNTRNEKLQNTRNEKLCGQTSGMTGAVNALPAGHFGRVEAGSVGQTVGYRTRYEGCMSSRTRVQVITDGILARQLQGFAEPPWSRHGVPCSHMAVRTLRTLAPLALAVGEPQTRGVSEPAVCAALEPLGIYEQIFRDLGRYANLDLQRLSLYDGFCLRRRRACIRLRVVDGIPYVLDMFPGYQSRHRSTLHALWRVLVRFGPLPNLEVTIDVTDGELQNIDLPIFVITHKKEEPRGILYPDFTFYSWPESTCPPNEMSHDYSYLYDRFKHWHHRHAPPEGHAWCEANRPNCVANDFVILPVLHRMREDDRKLPHLDPLRCEVASLFHRLNIKVSEKELYCMSVEDFIDAYMVAPTNRAISRGMSSASVPEPEEEDDPELQDDLESFRAWLITQSGKYTRLSLRLPVTGAGPAKPVMDNDETLPMEVEGEMLEAISQALAKEPVVENGNPAPRDFDAEIPVEKEPNANQAILNLLSNRHCRVLTRRAQLESKSKMNEERQEENEAEAPKPAAKGKAKAKAKAKANAEGGGRGRKAKKSDETENQEMAKGDGEKGDDSGAPAEAEKKPRRARGKAKAKKPEADIAVAPAKPHDDEEEGDEIDHVKTPVKRLFEAVSDDEEPEEEDSLPFNPPIPEGKAGEESKWQRLRRLSVEMAPEPAKAFVAKTIEKPAPKRRYRAKKPQTSPSGSTQAVLASPAVKKEQVRRRRAKKNQEDQSSCVEDPLMKGIFTTHLKASENLPFDALQVYCREKVHVYKYKTCRLNPYFGRAASGVKYMEDPAEPEVIYYSFKNGVFNHRVAACYAEWMDENKPDVETRFDPHSTFSCLMTKIKYNAQDPTTFQWVEFFAGQAAATAAMKEKGLSTARLDYEYRSLDGWKKKLDQGGAEVVRLVRRYIDKKGKTRNYPTAFGQKFADLHPRLVSDKKGMPELPPKVPSAAETFASLDWGDLWPEAHMVSVCHWLRGSMTLKVPSSFRHVLPKRL
eukprot:s940_g10.t1